MLPFSLITLIFSGSMLLEDEFGIKILKSKHKWKKLQAEYRSWSRAARAVISWIWKGVWKLKGKVGRQSKRTDRMTWHQEFWVTLHFKDSLLRGKPIWSEVQEDNRKFSFMAETGKSKYGQKDHSGKLAAQCADRIIQQNTTRQWVPDTTILTKHTRRRGSY